MTKKLLPIIAAALAVVAVVGWYRSCRLDKRLAEAREKYRTQVVETELLKSQSDQRIADLLVKITEQSDIVSGLKVNILRKDEQIATLSTRLDELQNTEPPTTPEIEALPIVVNLRGQVARLTEMFNLSQEAGALKDREIASLEEMYRLERAVSEEWRGQYDLEHALRLSAESLINKTMRSYKASKFLNKAAIVAVVGAVAYGLLK